MIVLSSFRARLGAYERDLAAEALKVTHGGIIAAARLCGLHKSSMLRIVRRHGLQSLQQQAPRSRLDYRDETADSGGNAAWKALGDV